MRVTVQLISKKEGERMNQETAQNKYLYVGRKLPYHQIMNPQEIPSTSKIIQAVQKNKATYQCFRCGNREQNYFCSHFCARCSSMCTYCRKCIVMGKMTTCTKLIVNELDMKKEDQRGGLEWDGKLSPQQKEASLKVMEAVKGNTDLLLWAVCGAGKTEMLFEAIDVALQEGKFVCIATPRVDVVIELAKRFQTAFPKTPIAILYGGSEDKWEGQRITISTVHQLMNFRRIFHLLIIDEVDAFPYNIEEHLHWVVDEARTKTGSTIQLTATPSTKQQHLAHRDKIEYAMAPARYHRQPLPVPDFQWIGNWRKTIQKNNKLPAPLMKWLQSILKANSSIFLFIPTIDISSAVEEAVKKLTVKTTSVHSQDPLRHEKVSAFRNGDVSVLITTTILERGVTIKNSQIAVLGSDEEIFTESALVQISGRAGRHIDYPSGEIMFFHNGISEEMVRAKKQILQMNQLGFEKGWLDKK
ncbi:DEAD/DEAH box helicase [Gottfriedia solisilvae]|uniref:DEAD/DEAH box helicase n=1 Tax=Gottfriedia solisilvae TaxID=1516104 RepID=UPI003D2EEBB3